MRVVILAGGMGTRLQEETALRPKPMVEIGGMPILCHIMKHYRHHGFREFLVALGYMGDYIKDYFLDRYNLSGHLSIDFDRGRVSRQQEARDDWQVHLIETGTGTLTGGRLKRLEPWLRRETFLVTYGDGVSNVDLTELVAFHRAQGRLGTVTAVRPPARFGGLLLENDCVANFTEKPVAGEGWINGGFLVLEPEVLHYISGDNSSLEADVLERLAQEGQLSAFRHPDFWQCMDTMRDKTYLEKLWREGQAPWCTWSQDAAPSAAVARKAA